MISAILPKKNYLQKSCKTVYNTFVYISVFHYRDSLNNINIGENENPEFSRWGYLSHEI